MDHLAKSRGQQQFSGKTISRGRGLFFRMRYGPRRTLGSSFDQMDLTRRRPAWRTVPRSRTYT